MPTWNKYSRWITTFAYAGFIFYLSSRTWGGPPLFPNADKIIHALLYLILGGLVVWALRATTLRGRGAIFPLAATAAALYGITDEIHQMFVPGRNADPLDWIADAVGAILGAWIANHAARRIRKEREAG